MKCPICSSPSEVFYDDRVAIQSYRCQECNAFFKDRSSYQNLAIQKKRYDLHQNDPSDDSYRAYFQSFLDFVLPHIDIDIVSFLDFGSGRSTLLADMMSRGGVEAIAYDPIYRPDMDYQSRRYGLIASVEVFEHLHHPQETFAHLVSLLEDEGYLAVKTEFAPKSVDEYLKWYYPKDPTHVIFYSPKSFEHLAEENNLTIKANNNKNIILFQKKG